MLVPIKQRLKFGSNSPFPKAPGSGIDPGTGYNYDMEEEAKKLNQERWDFAKLAERQDRADEGFRPAGGAFGENPVSYEMKYGKPPEEDMPPPPTFNDRMRTWQPMRRF